MAHVYKSLKDVRTYTSCIHQNKLIALDQQYNLTTNMKVAISLQAAASVVKWSVHTTQPPLPKTHEWFIPHNHHLPSWGMIISTNQTFKAECFTGHLFDGLVRTNAATQAIFSSLVCTNELTKSMEDTRQMSHQGEHNVEQQLPSEPQTQVHSQGREEHSSCQCQDVHHTDAAPGAIVIDVRIPAHAGSIVVHSTPIRIVVLH